ncbi:MAG: aldehyde ferredoxin oxidoreductase family protein [Candidatus Nezhaarchaeota archaeon]|nr:aldehyde ferredoxin oxidoreductase family protein [Candidatus Nezhaarchaeota archaeon]MCX8141379.1 aldehyde ferredoxin oxidoreductase family protein [Candidatus Nezhaarchaeota archaeon]MDW8049645.1 aldehyde ferredoxin oxidoreductase family protein [Nitrososphaerota archaeon]
MPGGYMGKILRVDLSVERMSEEHPDEDVLRMFLGCGGLATKYLFEEVKRGVDPLGPHNKLILMTGPLTGIPAPTTGRYVAVSKSPLTNIWGLASSGGFWGVALKRSGFDGIILEGVSPKPVYLVIDSGRVELRDANHLWGKSTSETTKLIKEELGDDFKVACIGIAGENLVKYAAIINDADRPGWGRAAGRCGMGAVMGSKRLKAIAVRGAMRIKVADEDAVMEQVKKMQEQVGESILKMSLGAYGTAAVLDLVNAQGGFPTRNWQIGVFRGAENINGMAISEKILKNRKACFACPIACGRVCEVKDRYASSGEGPEYESLGSFGGMCEIDDLNAIAHAHFLCNEYGLDTISAGSTIAFAMECYERGLLTKEDTGGLEIKFGDAGVMIELVHKIARREGIGDLLAEGTRAASKRIGRGSEKFAMHVKGLELPAYDPRAAKLVGLAYATANRGGCHITAYVQGPTFLSIPFLVVEQCYVGDILQEIPETAKVVKDLEDALTVLDAVGACKFVGIVLTAEDWAALISSVTGWNFTVEDFRRTGERIYNLQRAFNVREGLRRADDTLPRRLLEEPLPEGPAKGHVVNLEPLLDAYYRYRGWDEEGRPTPEKLKELGLEWVIKEVYH